MISLKTLKRLLAVVSSLLYSLGVFAFNQEEVYVPSESMSKSVPVTIITPDSYSDGYNMPVIYLLHGFGDNHMKWSVGGHVGKLADFFQVIVVMPDGGYSSWYFDSPVMPEYKYETFIAKELVSYVDSHYKTLADRGQRAITGNSMGGHGAMYLAFRHQDVFGNAGSLSGGVDIRPFSDKWQISSRLGPIDTCVQNWEENTVVNMTHLLSPGSLNIVFDCGTEDFFYDVNLTFHIKLLEGKIPHDFYSRPGKHCWDYWFNSIRYHFLFFFDKFQDMRKSGSN